MAYLKEPLRSIFCETFVDTEPSTNRLAEFSTPVGNDIVEKLINFIDKYALSICAPGSLERFIFVKNVLSNDSSVYVKFYGNYKCALIATQHQDCSSVLVRDLKLVGVQHSRYIDQIHDEFFNKFKEEFNKQYNEKIKEEKIRKERAHPTTPAFIEEIVRKTVSVINGEISDCSAIIRGWSDIDHAGGDWPIISSVFKHLLGCALLPADNIDLQSLHTHFLCLTELNLLEAEVDKSLPFGDVECDVRSCINGICIMLESVALKVTTLVGTQYDVSCCIRRIVEIRSKIDLAVSQYGEMVSKRFMLPLDIIETLPTLPSIQLPSLVTIDNDQTLVSARKMAQSNIQLQPIPNSSEEELVYQNVVEFISKCDSMQYRVEVMSLVLHTIETLLFDLSGDLDDESYRTDIEELEKLAYHYRTCCHRYRNYIIKKETGKRKAILKVQLLSKEILVMFTVYSLIHKSMKIYHPLISEYGVPLNWKDVSHLVFAERSALDASLNVATYLKKNTMKGKELFSLSNQERMLEFATRFASTFPQFVKLWDSEKQAADRREQTHWTKVQEKQEEVRRLQEELEELQAELETLNAKLDSLDSWKKTDKAAIKTTNRKISSVTSSIHRVQDNIWTARRPPDSVFQPLPKNASIAFQIIFFLHMEQDFKVLSSVGIAAQQLLLPTTIFCKYTGLDGNKLGEIDQKVIYPQPPMTINHLESWENYYNSHLPMNKISCDVLLPYTRGKPPMTRNVGPSDVMDFHQSSQGVWHPDELNPILLWNGGRHNIDHRYSGGQHFNPFIVIKKEDMVEYFTENLEESSISPIQWTINQYGNNTPLDRGNRGIAMQNLRPTWLNKHQWLTFASLRAFPYQQLRKICCTLCDRSLPLDDPHVQLLIRQTLYHTGDLSIDEQTPITALWKRDLKDDEFCDVILTELKLYAEELSSKPRNHTYILVLLEIANYVIQWYPQCVDVLRLFVEILYHWIDDLENQMKDAPPKDIPNLRAKKGLFYKYALLSFAKRPSLSCEDASLICKLIVNAQNESVFQEVTQFDEELKTLTLMCHAAMSELIEPLTAKVTCDMLTDAVKLIIHETPDNLPWKWMRYDGSIRSSCFEAVSEDDNLFNINLINGIVLYNGKPLSRLPASILKHQLYKRCFGDRNFETCWSQNTVKTVSPLRKKIYEFGLHNGDLRIVEYNIESKIKLMLLNPYELGEDTSWGFELPVILKENYSHWYYREEKIILLRGKFFCDDDVSFIIKYDTNNNHWKCFRVPSYRCKDIWNEYLHTGSILDELDFLVTNNFQATEILKKIEPVEYIHTYKSGKELIFDFPRLKLSFRRREDGGIESEDYANYRLSKCQQLGDTLLHFSRYFILQHVKYETEMKIIIPQGEIRKDIDEVKVLPEDGGSTKEWRTHTYNIHPRLGYLQANSIGARIFLAELYAATGTLLPEQRMQMTGGEVALRLLRRCWVNKPLTVEEYDMLQNIKKLRCRTPALDLLAYDVASSSVQLKHLYPSKLSTIKVKFPAESVNDYLQQPLPLNPKSALTRVEELRLLHQNAGNTEIKRTWMKETLLMKEEDSVKQRYEDLLKSLLKEVKSKQKEFCLNLEGNKTKLMEFIMKNLKQSHDAFNEVTEFDIGTGFNQLLKFLSTEVEEKRILIENNLLSFLFSHTDCDENETDVFLALRAANMYPQVSLEDLLKATCCNGWLESLNPCISRCNIDTIKHNILIWMKLCTLEDKFTRLLRICDGVDDSDQMVRLLVKKELSVCRTWSIEEHPDWCVFEVEQQIQIRPVQHTIAQSIIDRVEMGGNGPITQLNMGEGKTRVILPMLIMYWRNKEFIRINILSPLLSEAFDYMHSALCASVVDIKIFLLPFSRDVYLTPENVEAMRTSMNYASNTGGVLLVAPEHRLSLKLKRLELEEQGSKLSKQVCKSLQYFDEIKYLDILDECDEILRIKYKLIYAVGTQQLLPSGSSRWNVMEALCLVLKDSRRIQDLLSKPLISQRALKSKDGNNLAEMFPELRILPGKAFDDIRHLLMETLVKELASNPPHELLWMKDLKKDLKDVIQFVTDPSKEDMNWERYDSKQIEHILALRGYLSGDIFVHCLTKRNRVDYGVDRESGKKKMATPFRACETPAFRAEFGHPDCALMYTCLAYYQDGLSDEEVLQAFKSLLSLGENAQSVIYNEWFSLSKTSITEECHEEKLSSVSKIDLTNSIMFDLLVQYFRYNVHTINFWLNTNIFPREMMQFTHHLEGTSWDLATNQNNIAGFSGTNDDMVIIPSTLEWVEQEDNALAGTDGKMLYLLHEKAEFLALENEPNEQWKSILDLTMKDECYRALIDAGALMAGAHSNLEVAKYLADHLNEKKFLAVIYFDIPKNGWFVRDKFGRTWPKHSSPILEKNGFVYFDESRCRGADMKLNLDARAVLTLGPNMCKDKLMQAAGRLRLLEQGQRILLVAADDVTEQICYANDIDSQALITAAHVLKWVTSNTVQSVAKWLPEWAFQGGHYLIKKDHPKLALIPEVTSLSEMYGHSLSEIRIDEAWDKQRSNLMERRNNKEFSEAEQSIMNKIDEQIKKFGCEYDMLAGNVDEECERELEKELEVEEEVERQVPMRKARCEQYWDVDQLLVCNGPLQIQGQNSNCRIVKSLQEFLFNFIRYEGKQLNTMLMSWPPFLVYGTENFFHACESDMPLDLSSLNDYLRHVEHFVVFKNGQVLMVSEREADEILKLTFNAACSISLVSLTYARARNNQTKSIKLLSPPGRTNDKINISDQAIAVLQLFQGEVTYTPERIKVIKAILSTKYGKLFAANFPYMRGKGCNYPRSDLETICCENEEDSKDAFFSELEESEVFKLFFSKFAKEPEKAKGEPDDAKRELEVVKEKSEDAQEKYEDVTEESEDVKEESKDAQEKSEVAEVKFEVNEVSKDVKKN